MVWVELLEQSNYDFNKIVKLIKAVIEKRKIDVQDKSIFLKVSFVFPVRDFERVKMIITNPTFIAAVSLALLESGAKLVLIGDGETFACAQYAFEVVEIKKELKRIPKSLRKKIRLCYLDEVPKEIVRPEKPFLPNIEFDYPKIVKDVDIFISLPKLKVNIFADVTLSVKNGMGLISKKYRLKYHSDNLHELISDIYQIRQPDYVITDAIFAGEGQGPMEATAYPTNLIIFGNNGPAVDSICCYLMEYDQKAVKHLQYLVSRGFGPDDLSEIEIGNADLLETHKHSFIKPDCTIKNIAENIKVFQGECCVSGCAPFIRALLDGYGLRKGREKIGNLTLMFGKDVQIPDNVLSDLKKRKRSEKKRVMIYGDCVQKYKDLGVYYGGCPPDYINALMTFPLRTKMGFSPWINYVKKWIFVKTMILSKFRKLFKIYPQLS